MGRYELWAHCGQCARWYYVAATTASMPVEAPSTCPVCRVEPDRTEIREDAARPASVAS